VVLPRVNLKPVNVILPVVIKVEEIFCNTGLVSSVLKVNQQFYKIEQFVGIINLLSTVIT
jgi:hypothetical protein